MKLSIIITTYNRSQSLLQTLQSLLATTAKPEDWECIVVNNNSKDNTEMVLQEFIQSHDSGFHFRWVTEIEQGLSAARNRGYYESQGEAIVYVDDDERIDSNFIQAYIDFFDRYPDVGVGSGKVIPEYPTGKPTWLSPLTEKPIAFPVDLGKSVKPYPRHLHPAGCNFALRRSVLKQVGLFNNELGRKGGALLGGEEYELISRVRKAGIKIMYVPDAVIWHIIGEDKLNDTYFNKLTYSIGIGQKARSKSRLKLYVQEIGKWVVLLPILAYYCLIGRSQAAKYLLRMRNNISRGIFGSSNA